MNIFTKIKEVLFRPGEFFLRVDKEKGVGEAFVYYSVLALFSSVLGVIVLSIWPRAYTWFLPLPVEVPISLLIRSSLFNFVLSLGLTFVLAWGLHIWIKAFRGKGKYTDTYKLYVYSATPKLVFGWIPFVNLLIWIYSLVLLIIGTNKMYKFSSLKATLMYIVPWLVIMFITVIIILLAISYFIGSSIGTF